jgi:hypothetical protein
MLVEKVDFIQQHQVQVEGQFLFVLMQVLGKIIPEEF